MLARAGDVRELAAGTLLVPVPPRLSTVPENDELISPRPLRLSPDPIRRLQPTVPVRRLLSSPLAGSGEMPRLQSTPTSAPSIGRPNSASLSPAQGAPPHVRFAPSPMLLQQQQHSSPNVSTVPVIARATVSSPMTSISRASSTTSSLASPCMMQSRVSPFATAPQRLSIATNQHRFPPPRLVTSSPTRTVTLPPPPLTASNSNLVRAQTSHMGPVRTTSPVYSNRQSTTNIHNTSSYEGLIARTTSSSSPMSRISFSPTPAGTRPASGPRTSPLHWQPTLPPLRSTLSSSSPPAAAAAAAAMYRSMSPGGGFSSPGVVSPAHTAYQGVSPMALRELTSVAMAASPMDRSSIMSATISRPMRPYLTADNGGVVSPSFRSRPADAFGMREEVLTFPQPPDAQTLSRRSMATYTVPSVMYSLSPTTHHPQTRTTTTTEYSSSAARNRLTSVMPSPVNVTRGSVTIAEPTGWLGRAEIPPPAGAHSTAEMSRSDHLAKMQATIDGFQSAGLSEQIDEERRNLRKGVRMAPRDPKFTARLEKLSESRYQRAFCPSMDVKTRVMTNNSRGSVLNQMSTAAAKTTPQIRIVPPTNNPFIVPTTVWKGGRRVEMSCEEHAALKKIYSMDASTSSILSRSVSQSAV